jgi:hypothetical protein
VLVGIPSVVSAVPVDPVYQSRVVFAWNAIWKPPVANPVMLGLVPAAIPNVVSAVTADPVY